MALDPGTKLAHYEILSSLGAGGMGEVYRAKDTKLGREVAIKLLLEEVSSDPERLARFEREARVLASLNHPNIATLHGFEQEGDASFLVMELVEGETLADRIARGPIPVVESIPLFIQIAEGLEAAHENGVIHRDLKPANIKIGDDGRVKILDFGLAKAMALAGKSDLDPSGAPTITAVGDDWTRQGQIMGTAAYMSPEQARGEPVDGRTDVWAFGCVLFEMLTGTRPFLGQGFSAVLANVLKESPDWGALPGDTPALTHRLLRRCLEKESRDRLHHIADARIDLRDSVAGSPFEDLAGLPSASPVDRSKPPLWLMVAATAVVVGFAVWLVSSWTASDVVPQQVRFEIEAGMVNNPFARVVAISPDGTHIANAGFNAPLSVRSMAQLDKPFEIASGFDPFFSPDGEWIGFFSDGALRRISVKGGAPSSVALVAARSLGGSWGIDNSIVFASNIGLHRVSAEGGEPELLAAPDADEGELFFAWPEFLPGGRVVLFTIVPVGSAAGAQIAVLDLETLEQTIILRGGSSARYSSTGHLVYSTGTRLHAVAFDLKTLEVRGQPGALLDDLLMLTRASGANFDVSQTGTLVFVPAGTTRPGAQALVWVDRGGREELVPGSPQVWNYPRISPDGTRVALDGRVRVGVGSRPSRDLFVWDFERQSLSPLADGPTEEFFAVWSLDGRRVYFASDRSGVFNIWFRAADGTGQAERFLETTSTQFPAALTPDGSKLVAWQGGRDSAGPDLIALDVEHPEEVEVLLATDANEMNPAVSPDGEWLAYQSNDSGQFEIYVSPFPQVSRERTRISLDGGISPLWGAEGEELFYRSATGSLMAAAVELGESMVVGDITEVVSRIRPPGLPVGGRPYDISPIDGRFLITKPLAPAETRNITVVLNWSQELERLVPIE